MAEASIALLLAGIAGCLATAALAKVAGGVPWRTIAGNPYKHVWSVIYALPVPFLVGWGWPGLVLAWLWLTVSPVVGVKAYFGPKDRSWGELLPLHALSYAPVTLLTYIMVRRLIG